MPGYGGGVGADTDGPNADYGEGMGTKGAAAADHSIGTGAGGDGRAMSQEAFQAAINQALGRVSAQLDDDPWGGATSVPDVAEDEANAASVRDTMEAMGMFDDPSNTDPVSPDSAPVGPTRSFQEQAMDDAYFGGQITDPGAPTLDDPQGTEEGLRAAQAVERSMNLGKRAKGARNPGKVAQNNLADLKSKKAYLDEVEEREKRVTELEAIKNRTRQEQNELNNLKNLINQHKMTDRYSKAYTTVYGTTPFGKAFLAGAPFGFGLWGPKVSQALIDRGFVDDRTFDDVSFEIENNVNRPDSFLENYINNLPASAYDEPWMKGLNERQIKYYLDRPEELEWVRNLWNQMNLSESVTGQSGSGTFAHDVIQTWMDGFNQTGIVWKPQSENDNNLVVLTPPDFDSANASIENEAGDVLDTGRNMGRTNGGRFTYRFSRPGAQYQGPIYLRINNTRYKIDNPGARVN